MPPSLNRPLPRQRPRARRRDQSVRLSHKRNRPCRIPRRRPTNQPSRRSRRSPPQVPRQPPLPRPMPRRCGGSLFPGPRKPHRCLRLLLRQSPGRLPPLVRTPVVLPREPSLRQLDKRSPAFRSPWRRPSNRRHRRSLRRRTLLRRPGEFLPPKPARSRRLPHQGLRPSRCCQPKLHRPEARTACRRYGQRSPPLAARKNRRLRCPRPYRRPKARKPVLTRAMPPRLPSGRRTRRSPHQSRCPTNCPSGSASFEGRPGSRQRWRPPPSPPPRPSPNRRKRLAPASASSPSRDGILWHRGGRTKFPGRRKQPAFPRPVRCRPPVACSHAQRVTRRKRGRFLHHQASKPHRFRPTAKFPPRCSRPNPHRSRANSPCRRCGQRSPSLEGRRNHCPRLPRLWPPWAARKPVQTRRLQPRFPPRRRRKAGPPQSRCRTGQPARQKRANGLCQAVDPI